MAQLFVQAESSAWSVLDLTHDTYRLSLPAPREESGREASPLTRGPRAPVVEPAPVGQPAQPGELLLVRAAVGDTEPVASPAGWALLGGEQARFRVNGVGIAVGIAVLRHRDELCLEGGLPLYFSTERLVSVEVYPADDSPHCPRCTLPIDRGQSFVRCPGCSVLHHELPERKCWTYSGTTCTLCDHASDLEAGYRWSPEAL